MQQESLSNSFLGFFFFIIFANPNFVVDFFLVILVFDESKYATWEALFILFLIVRKFFNACSRINKIIGGVNFGFAYEK